MFTIIDPGRSQCKRPISPIIGCRTQDFRSPHWPRNHFQKVFPNFHQCHPHCHRRWQVSTVGSVDPLLKAGVNPNLPCSKDSLADPAWGGWKDHLHKCLNLAERLRVWNVMRQSPFFHQVCVAHGWAPAAMRDGGNVQMERKFSSSTVLTLSQLLSNFSCKVKPPPQYLWLTFIFLIFFI